MKKLKILALAFVIGSSSLLATTLEKPYSNNNFEHHPIKNGVLEINNESDKNDTSKENYIYTSQDTEKLYNLNYNNKELYYQEMQLKAVKNYASIMPDIIGKE